MADVDALVDHAVAAVSALARRASSLTTGTAVAAAVIVGSAYLVGLAAFDGSARAGWAVVGGISLLFAVGAPLLATYRLRAIPRHKNDLVAELRTLLHRDDEAKRVVIETVEADPQDATLIYSRGGFAPGGTGGTRTPAAMAQFQRITSLGSFATADDLTHIATVGRTVRSLPRLVATGIVLTATGALLGFIFTLILIF